MTDATLKSFAPLHMLVVDDDAMAREVLTDHYKQYGFTVDAAADGAAALAAIEARKPDLILCDRVMPTMSGAELLDVVRKRGAEWQDILFVFITALTDRRDRYAMMPLHPDAYLNKPIMFNEADRTLAELLQKKRGSGAGN